jgi:NADH-quinone oxidoreductase subunit E/NADP-reducing hydrogenase subunit HndA
MEQQVDNLLEEFTLEQIDELNNIIEKYRVEPGGIIPLLEEAQDLLGYLPITIQKQISNKTNIPLSRIYGIVTFYSFFTITPRGKHTVQVEIVRCLGACGLAPVIVVDGEVYGRVKPSKVKEILEQYK